MNKQHIILTFSFVFLLSQPGLAKTIAIPPNVKFSRACSFLLHKMGFDVEHPGVSKMEPKALPVRVVKNAHTWYFAKDTRTKTEHTFKFLDDLEYIQERRIYDRLGSMRSFFSNEFDTRVYYTATGAPDAAGKIPVVDPKSRALFIYFHGSGTNKASGINFSYKANKLASLGYSVLSFDLPYHADGARNGAKYHNPEAFYAMVRDLINKYRVPGQPVYLTGHSYGPEIAAEFVVRYPFEVNGILGISPASFNKALQKWFEEKTAKMTALWGPMISNDAGASWAGIMAMSHIWKIAPGKNRADPQALNPDLKVKWLSGEFEEYVPGQLNERGLPTKAPRDYDMKTALLNLFPKSEVIIEPGVGHYIFEHKDQNGHDVIMRELLALDNQTLFNEQALKDSAKSAQLSDSMEFARRFQKDPFFNHFVSSQYKGEQTLHEILASNDTALAKKITNDFSRYVMPQRDRALALNIQKTSEWNQTFYLANQAEIDALDLKKPRPSDALLNSYFEMLESLPLEVRTIRAAVSEEVYVIPVKQIPDFVRQQMENGQVPQGKKPKKEGKGIDKVEQSAPPVQEAS